MDVHRRGGGRVAADLERAVIIFDPRILRPQSRVIRHGRRQLRPTAGWGIRLSLRQRAGLLRRPFAMEPLSGGIIARPIGPGEGHSIFTTFTEAIID